MTTKPTFVIYSKVEPKYRSEDFFDREDKTTSKFLELLQNPIPIRRMGWNLATLDYAKIVNGGEAWEVNNGDRKKIRIYRDGSVLITGSIDNNFLGWGKNSENSVNPEINNLALTEFTYEAVQFIKHLYTILEYETGKVIFTVAMEDSVGLMLSSENYRYLPSGDGKILEKNFKEKVETSIPDLKEKTNEVAYRIVESIYHKFNIETTQIPYVINRKINIDFIKGI